MKLNTLKRKPICALALVLFMVVPMLMALSPVSAAGPTGVFSAVQSGTTNVNSISLPSSPNPINTTVEIDIRIDNASGIWGWSIPTISWNPTVLQLTGVAEGPFLADNTGSDPTFFIGNSKGLWNNVDGLIDGGLSEAIQADATSIASSGVVATLTFTVVGSGTTPVTIAGGNLRANSNDTVGVNVTCNSASVAVPASISVYVSGTQNAIIQQPLHQNPINTTFEVDLYINGPISVWGWNVGVTWNATVLQLISITEGSYLNQFGSTLFLPGYIDNKDGQVQAGISDAYESYMTANASSGVLATLKFEIISFQYGWTNGSISVTAGTPATLLNSAYPHQAIGPVVFNNASYSMYRIPGDVIGNGYDNMGDIVDILMAFGSTPGMPNWNPVCDIQGIGRINMGDVVIALLHFGQHYP